ncbi:hypothetical protein T07_12337 [Trichinella nelsoni]|uniref:Uncharacterized protein n=1 Tax=Trichinella nelsoni TaxID=6336 RepID=A0A0V0RG54_9BILA|nr:hypothetical protein T07_12337 [Trichinella nelsoni]
MHEFRDIFEVFPSVDRCIELIPEGLELENISIEGWQLRDRPSCVGFVVVHRGRESRGRRRHKRRCE